MFWVEGGEKGGWSDGSRSWSGKVQKVVRYPVLMIRYEAVGPKAANAGPRRSIFVAAEPDPGPIGTRSGPLFSCPWMLQVVEAAPGTPYTYFPLLDGLFCSRMGEYGMLPSSCFPSRGAPNKTY
ncbi:hypothetical protein C6I21_14220 [Alkalicoccus urumqiensis]|uniref:Uncharacterized protein n=1 Tax=Alkalicoccus urumqiensis TaxID=1548213 RepID=A0A2P6MDX1_ALKUR|nr:hypothetical protein C6I21_14220 [Alkalicoccus urumqiensis]